MFIKNDTFVNCLKYRVVFVIMSLFRKVPDVSLNSTEDTKRSLVVFWYDGVVIAGFKSKGHCGPVK